MKKTLFILPLIFSAILFSGPLFARTPTPTPSGDPDIQSSYTMECLNPPADFGRDSKRQDGLIIGGTGRAPTEITLSLSGMCSSPFGCDLTLCSIEQFENVTRADLRESDELEAGAGVGKSSINYQPGDEKCTTGNAEKDIYYFGQDYVGATAASLTAPSLVNNHMNPGPVNNLQAILKSNDGKPIGHTFLSFYATGGTGTFIPTTSADEELDPTLSSNRTQQLGTARGTVPSTSVTLMPGEQGDCETLWWDPYGRIFDGVSLEPLNKNEATVTLLNKDNNVVAIPGNNVKTDILGKYNILIKDDGEYRLNVTASTPHQFTDFFPDSRYKDLYESIFMPGSLPFFESVKDPKRVDVALKPISTPYSRQISVVQNDYKQVWTGGKKYIKIDLRVTHPKSTVRLIVNDIVVKNDGEGNTLPLTADKNGYWKIMVRDKVLSQKGFRVEISKNPQYYMFAGSSGNKLIIDFDPILAYIEGYAYDDNGLILPGTKIQVRLKMNNSVFYETRSNEQGFFTIDSTNLPPMDYYLVFVDPSNNLSIKKTTAKFVNENTAYLDKEKINLLKGEKNGQLVDTNIKKQRDFSLNDIIQKNDLEKNILNKQKLKNAVKKNNYSLIIGFIMLITLTIGAGAILVLLFFRKPKTTF